MRRMAALLLLFVLCPANVKAQDAYQPGLQVLLQTGLVARTDPSLNLSHSGPAGTIGLLWTPWAFGGIWSEFGVMEVAREHGLGLPAFGSDTRFDEHLYASCGGIIQGSDKNSVCPYLRAGVGAYRIESDFVSPKLITSAPIEAFDSGNPGHLHWTMGATIAGGARFGPSSWHALPTLEGRVQIEPGDPGVEEAHLCLLGGVWFR